MKHIYFLFFSALLLMASACTTVSLPAKENMFKNKIFVHLYFETEEECMASQPDPDFFLNCHRQLDFLDDKKVQVMLTDILYLGTYEVSGEMLIINVDSPEVLNGEIIFEIINPAKLLKTDDNTLWKKVSGKSIWN